MSAYSQIEDPKELNSLNRYLSAKLKRALPHVETRTIGWPAGSFEGRVRFRAHGGRDVLWWWSASDGVNHFGHGDPGKERILNIEIQFHFPLDRFNRRMAGCLLRHLPTKRVLLAHSGIVTLGHGRILRSALFAETATTVIEADTSNGSKEFLVVGDLESANLINNIESFSSEVRRAAKQIGAAKPSVKHAQFGALRKYFDEFSGKRKRKGRTKSTSIAEVYHGDVVRKLRDRLLRLGEVLKSKEIDLVARMKTQALIFEVKTSIDPQSIYTATGQLIIHALTVAKNVKGVPVKKIIVLPTTPMRHLYDALSSKLGIRVLTFTRTPSGEIKIPGLQKLIKGPAK